MAITNKPRYLQKVFRFVPWLIYISAALIAISVNSEYSFASELTAIGNYTAEALNTMFSDSDQARENLIESTKQIANRKNVVVFAFTLLAILMLMLAPITLIMNWFSNDSKKNKVEKALGFVVTICVLWFLIWKLPSFVFSFFSFSKSVIYFGCFLAGMFSVGLVFFYTTLFVVKNVAQNLDDNKVK